MTGFPVGSPLDRFLRLVRTRIHTRPPALARSSNSPLTWTEVQVAPFQCHTVVVQEFPVQLSLLSAQTFDRLSTAIGPPNEAGSATDVQEWPLHTMAPSPPAFSEPKIHTSAADDAATPKGWKPAEAAMDSLAQAHPFQCRTSGRVAPLR